MKQNNIGEKLENIKSIIKSLGLEPYFGKPYQIFIKKPYWWIRRNVYRYPATYDFSGLTTKFTVEEPSDLAHHESQSEQRVMRDLLRSVDDDVFYDIGANIGQYTCVVGQVVNETVSVEPSPIANRKLRNNVDLNGLKARIFDVALSDESGQGEFAVDTDDPHSRQSTLLLGSKPDTNVGVREVRIERLDTLVDEHDLPEPTVVKIDVEGAEYGVLRGMGELLHSVDVIYCEIHNVELSSTGISKSDVVTFLSDNGFDITEIAELGGGTQSIKASRRS